MRLSRNNTCDCTFVNFMGFSLSESSSQSSHPAKQKICREKRYMCVSTGSRNKAVNNCIGCTVGPLPLVDTSALMQPRPTEPAGHEVFRGAWCPRVPASCLLPGLVMLPRRLLCEKLNKQKPPTSHQSEGRQ